MQSYLGSVSSTCLAIPFNKLVSQLERNRTMARTMEKIIPVKITTDEVQCYATEMRSNISATAKFDEMVMRHLSEIADNPAKG